MAEPSGGLLEGGDRKARKPSISLGFAPPIFPSTRLSTVACGSLSPARPDRGPIMRGLSFMAYDLRPVALPSLNPHHYCHDGVWVWVQRHDE